MKKFTVTLFSFFIFQLAANAQESLDDSIECTDVRVDYLDDTTMTRDERIRHMDEAFYRSLNKFELCQSEKNKTKSNSASSSRGVISDSANVIEDGDTSESTASSVMSGSDFSAEKNFDVDKESMSGSEVQSTKNENNNYESSISLANGKLPEDIPSADNDSLLAAQIRRAAENETDPVKKEQLWNEYRKYKGIIK